MNLVQQGSLSSQNNVSTLLTTVLLGCILFFLVVPKRRLKNFPPGPKSLGIFGNLPQFIILRPVNFLPELMRLGVKYGKIMGIKIGPHPAVVISDLNVLKQVLNDPKASGRPPLEALQLYQDSRRRGFSLNSGKEWKEMRRFAMTQFKIFGMGSSSHNSSQNQNQNLEGMISMEADQLIQLLQNAAETKMPFSSHGFFNIPSFNVLWKIMTGLRFQKDDPMAKKLVDAVAAVNEATYIIFIVCIYPIILKFPRFCFKSLWAKGELFAIFLSQFIKERRQKYEYECEHGSNDQEPQDDFTNAFIQKIDTTTKKQQVGSSFYGKIGYENLEGIIRDVFIAGTETTGSTMSWVLLYLALHPEKQKKLRMEIDRVLQGKMPTLEHQSQMPYTTAVINETLRKSSSLPLGLLNYAMETTTINEFEIPQGTWIISNNYAIHHCPEYWKDPYSFCPERFLTPDESDVVRHEYFVPFGMGKRFCLGEKLARNVLFIFITRIFREFSITLNPNERKPEMEAKMTIALVPQPHTLIISKIQDSRSEY